MLRDGNDLSLTLDRALATRALTAMEMLAQRETHLDPALRELRARLRDALVVKSSGDVTGATSTE